MNHAKTFLTKWPQQPQTYSCKFFLPFLYLSYVSFNSPNFPLSASPPPAPFPPLETSGGGGALHPAPHLCPCFAFLKYNFTCLLLSPVFVCHIWEEFPCSAPCIWTPLLNPLWRNSPLWYLHSLYFHSSTGVATNINRCKKHCNIKHFKIIHLNFILSR